MTDTKEARLPRPRTRPWVSALRVVFGAALLAFVLSRSGGAAGGAVQRLLSAPFTLLVLFTLPFAGNVLEAARLVTLVDALGIRLRLLPTCGVVAVSSLFNYAIPGGTGGDVMKLYYVGREHRGRLVETATALLADRVIALFTLLLVILGLSALDPQLVAAQRVLQLLVIGSVVGVVMLGTLALLSASRRLRRTALYSWVTTRAPLHQTLARLGDAILAFGERPAAVFRAMGFCIVGHIALVWMYVLLGRVIMPELSAPSVALLALLGMLANAIPVTPGGLGVGEAAFERLFQLVGHAGGAFLLVAWRVGMVPIALVGFAAYAGGLRGLTQQEAA